MIKRCKGWHISGDVSKHSGAHRCGISRDVDAAHEKDHDEGHVFAVALGPRQRRLGGAGLVGADAKLNAEIVDMLLDKLVDRGDLRAAGIARRAARFKRLITKTALSLLPSQIRQEQRQWPTSHIRWSTE